MKPALPYRLLLLQVVLIGVGSASFLRCAAVPRDVLDEIRANDNRTSVGAFEDGKFVVHLEARTGPWRPRLDADTAIRAVAFGERGRAPSVPGPLIRVPQGTDVRLTVGNDVPPGFPVHRPPPRFQHVGLSTVGTDVLIAHGLRAGTVAEDTIHVMSGATRAVTFRADRPGTYVYWGALTEATMEERRTRDATLSGVIVVDPAGSDPDPDERIFVITMIDAFPDTTRAETNLDVFEPAALLKTCGFRDRAFTRASSARPA